MKISECTVETNNIANLSDKPALTPAELKRQFDKAPSDIKEYINNILIEELKNILSSKVDTIKGKTLISNELIEKLGGIEEGANKLIITIGTEEPGENTPGNFYVQYFE